MSQNERIPRPQPGQLAAAAAAASYYALSIVVLDEMRANNTQQPE